MNPFRKEELVALALADELSGDERTEFDRLLRDDPDFAAEFDALSDVNNKVSALARAFLDQPQLEFDEDAIAAIRAEAVRHSGATPDNATTTPGGATSGRVPRRPWFLRPWVLGAGLAAACAVAIIPTLRQPAPARPAPPMTDAPASAAPVSDATRGQDVFAQASSRNPVTRLGVMTPDQPTARACLWIVEKEWNALTAGDRKALVAFLKSQVPVIRGNPGRFAGVPTTAPNYSAIVDNITRLRDDAFMVITMVHDGANWVRGRVAVESG